MDLLKYLQDCLERAFQEKRFEYNKNDEQNQFFIQYSIEVTFYNLFLLDCIYFQIIENFCYSVLSTPEIFANQSIHPEISSKEIDNDDLAFALKLYYHFQKYGLSHEFFHHLKAVFDKNKYNTYVPYLYKTLIENERRARIIESNSFFCLEFTLLLLNFDDYKIKLSEVVQLGIPWIPGPSNINLTKGFGSTTGNLLEIVSCLGSFVQISTFPNPIQNKENFDIVVNRISQELEHLKIKKDFNLKTKYYFDLISSYNSLLAEVFKSLLKKGNTQNVKSFNKDNLIKFYIKKF